ncbi:MAG: 2-oxoglutarate dehydrogenase complex dihydrolipoyllysine-residue succinyltransferase [Phycisphaeraceae bacterium]|nr:2-oxoglutarate dehydrogenase complex dihydrolipoyllysine-residue succinyltransferase [Phycisphaeraceae bacterium]
MPIDIVIPSVGESITEGVVAQWLSQSGDWVERDDVVMELETDKITVEIRAPESGALHPDAKVGDTVKVGSVVGRVDETAARPAGVGAGAGESPKPAAAKSASAGPNQQAQPAERARKATTHPPAAHAANGDLRATPLAEKMALQFGVDLASVTPTGAGHRVREQDVLAFLQSHPGQAAQAPASSTPAAHARSTRRERMTPLRQRIASRLVEAQHTAAMLTTFNECDMTAVMELRARHKEAFEKRHGVGLGFMSFFVAAAVSALKSSSKVNSFIVEDEGKPAIEHHDYCDVAVAVSTDRGLVVPVIRSAERLSFAEVERQIRDFASRARDGKLGIDEITGGTFTITNGGVFGSLMSTPILNPPQSAILGMHAIKNRAVEHPQRKGEIVLRPMMYLALSYDHRVVDGAEAVTFLRDIKECIEDPARLAIGV